MRLAPVHDEVVIGSSPDGTPVVLSYHRNVFAGSPPQPRSAPRPRVAASDPLQRLSVAPGAHADATGPQPLSAAQLENIRSMAARCGYLEPRNLSEACYPAHWLPELQVRRAA
jgi:hypothetical protein